MPSTTTRSSTTDAPRRNSAPPRHRFVCLLLLSTALPLYGSCDSADPVPAVDGPLVLEVRYPGEEPIAVRDSVSVWGTVGSGRAVLHVNGLPVPVAANGGFATFVPVPDGATPVLELRASKGADTLTRSVPIIRVQPVPDPTVTVRPVDLQVRLRRLADPALDSATLARPVFSRWTPGGAMALPLTLGLRLRVDAETDDAVRLRLSRGVGVWVPRNDTEPLAGRRTTPRTVGELRTRRGQDRRIIRIDVSEPVPDAVERSTDRLRWTLFDATVGPAVRVESGPATMRDLGDGRVLIEVELDGPALGWRTAWRDGAMTLEIRDDPRPGLGPDLKGLVVAVDAGHPPGGSTGPTGLYEGTMTLAVANEVARQLAARGATPILTRTDEAPVSLDARIALAEQADAHVFVSIHANAPGDGRPPWSVDGTRVFWTHHHVRPLARALRDSVAAALGQVPHGVNRSDLAVLRPTWYPATLIEGTALTLPEREALLRSPAGTAAYAAGVVAGLAAWVAGTERERERAS